MRENLNLKHTIDLKHTISEVTSISLENDYQVKDSNIIGTFKIEGMYKTHGLSLNQEEINIEIPYNYEINDRIEKDTIKVDVIDFNYSIEATNIEIDIDYIVEADEVALDDFDDIEEFDRFLKEHEVDVIDLKEEDIKIEEEQKLDNLEEEKELVIEDRTIENTIIENISQKEDSYITYHVYVCDETDTLESIKSKYNTTEDVLREYNDSLEITCGMKLIIPCQDE